MSAGVDTLTKIASFGHSRLQKPHIKQTPSRSVLFDNFWEGFFEGSAKNGLWHGIFSGLSPLLLIKTVKMVGWNIGCLFWHFKILPEPVYLKIFEKFSIKYNFFSDIIIYEYLFNKI